MNNGYIKIHRKFIDWEWYSNLNDRVVFIHCLLKANWKDGIYQGYEIPRGSFVTGRNKLAKEIGISEQSVRTSLEHLKSTNTLTITSTKKFSIISINNYDKYQAINQQNVSQLTTNEENNNINLYMHVIKNAYARDINFVEMELIEQWSREYHIELVKEAVRRSLLKRNQSLSYPNGILKSWKSKGYSCIEDVYVNEGKVAFEEKEEPVEIFTCDWLNMEEFE